MDSKIMKNRSLFLIGMAFVILSIFFSPGRIGTFIAENLSEDGILSDYFIYALIFLRIVSLITGLSCLVFLVLSRAFPEWIQACKKWLAGEKGAFWILIFILILGGILRFHHLGEKSLWLDETHTYVTVSHPHPGPLIASFRAPAAVMPPFYYLLLKASLVIFGKSEFSLRLVTCLAGIMSIAAVYKLTQKLWDRQMGLVAAFIMAVNVFHVSLSQIARRYELSVLLAICSMLFFLYMLDRKSRIVWMLYPLTTILGLYTSHFFALVVLVQIIYLLVTPILIRLNWKRLIIGYSLIAIICLPLFLIWVEWVITGGESTGYRVGSPNWRSVINLFKCFLVNDESGWGYQLFFPIALLGLYLGFLSRESSLCVTEGLKRKNGQLMMLLWLVVPISLCFILSRFFIQSFFMCRYFSIVSVPFYIFIAAGVIFLSKRAFIIWLVWVIFAFNLFFVILQYDPVKKEQWREAIAFLSEHSEKNDIILAQIHEVTTGMDFIEHTHKTSPLDYYYSGQAEVIALPHNLERQELAPYYRSIRNRLEQKKDFWLIIRKAFERGQTSAFVLDLAGGNYQIVAKKTWPGVLLYRFEGVKNPER